MKYLPNIAGVLLGLLFLMASVMFFLKLGPVPVPPPGSAIDHFNQATFATGFMHFVKTFELIGAVLVMIPKLRNFGLLALGPIILNIVAFHAFVARAGVFDPMLIVICLLALYLLWSGRKQFAGLLR